jgi:hypothetical protein
MRISKNVQFLLFVIIFLACKPLAFAGFGFSGGAGGLYLSESLIGYSFNFNNGPSSLQQRIYGSSESDLGYVFSSSFYLGGQFTYTSVNDKFSDSSSNSYTHQETYQYYGPTIGYMGDGIFLWGTYYLAAEKKDVVTSNNPTQNYDYTGNGFGLNLGYRFPVAGFEMAPMLAYRYVSYTNCKDPYSGATSTCNPTQIQSEFTPYVTFLFNFK